MNRTESTPERRIKVGIVQMQCSVDTDANLQKAMKMTREASERGARIVCLPELFRSRYFCQTEDTALFSLAEPIPGPTTQVFENLVRELNITAVVSIFEQRSAGLYHNSVAVIDGQCGMVGTYRKMHIPDDPRYYEKFYFTPGDLGFKAFIVGDTTIGTLICWDQWYPEAARLTALRGAEVLFYPTAIGWHPEEKEQFGDNQRAAWETIQRSHAIANGCYVAAVNRIGFEPDPASDSGGIQFWGSSFIAAPDGQVLFQAPADTEVVHVQELDLNLVGVQRHGWPFLRDRRIDAYDDITRRFID